MARKLKSDPVLFFATLLLICLSIVMVYSASAVVTLERYGRPSMFLVKQAMWAVLGLGLLGLVTRIDYRTYREPVFIWTALAIVLVALAAVLFMPPVNNARRWFGLAGIGVQPSEVSKLVVILFIAALLERRAHRINELGYAVAPIALLVGCVFALIVLEPDFGTSMSLVLIAFVMIFAAGLNYRYIAGAVLVALPAMYILVMGTAYRRRRMLTFLNPWEDPLGDGFQIIQSLIAVGTGGLWGKGLMNGAQKLFYLPGAAYRLHLLGHLGRTGTGWCDRRRALLLHRDLARRARRLARAGRVRRLSRARADDDDRGAGVHQHQRRARADADQRIPLPLVSFGGSSLLINLVGMGILLNVSQHTTPSAA